MTQDTPAALPVPTSATGGNWEEPTTVAQRLGDAMQLLCGGKRPPDDMVAGWLDNSSEDLQEFAANHGPAWAQGIGLIDAAMVMVDQPTEIITPDSDEDHEHRDAQAATSAAGGATPIDMVLHCPACGVQHIDEPDWQNDPQLGAIRYANAQQRIDTSGDREAQQSHHEPVQVLLRDGGMASGGHAEQPVQEVQLPATAIHEANKGMHVVSSGNGRFTVLQGQQNGQPSSEVQGLPQERNRRLEEDQSGRGESGGTSPKQSAARDEAIRLDARGVSGAPESSRADLQHLREGRASEAQEGPSIAGSLPCNGQDSGRAVLSLQHDAGLRERRLNVASQRDQVSCEAPLRAPIHRSHLCRPEDGGCGHIWRPADVPTNGVKAVKTVGKADSPIRAALAAQSPAVPANCERCSGSGEDPEGFCDQSRGPNGATHDGPCRTCNGTGAAQSPDSGAGSDKVLAELHLLEEVCAIYANDEDRYNDGRGEAYGSVPVQVGFKARAARKRVMERMAAAPKGDSNG